MSALTLLPLDLTASQLSNRVVETQTMTVIPGRPNRLIIPNFGGFYADHMEIWVNGDKLSRSRYRMTYLHEELTTMAGKAVYGLVVITDPTVPDTVELRYRAVGGPFGLSTVELAAVLDSLKEDELTLTFEDIAGLPREYPADEHEHEYWEVYGWDNVINALNRIADAIMQGDDGALDELDQFAKVRYEASEQLRSDLKDLMDQHMEDFNRPHQTTKAHIGLPNMNNWSIATVGQATNTSFTTAYMTPRRMMDALTVSALPNLNAHITDYNNPHNLTVADVGTYTVTDVQVRLDQKLLRGSTAVNTTLFDGKTYANITQDVRTNIPAGNVTEGRFHHNRLGQQTVAANRNNILTGAGNWRGTSAWINAFTGGGANVNYIGLRTSTTDAINHIRATYTSTASYPVGSVIMFAVQTDVRAAVGNGTNWHRKVELHIAMRTASNWLLMSP